MRSDNPFIQRIHSAPEELDNYEPIGEVDIEHYYLRGQNFKFTNPEKFVFIDIPILYFAIEIDDDLNVKSMLLYLDNHETMLDTLVSAFGPSDLSFNLEAQVNYQSGSEKNSYISNTWIREKYRMTFTILPLKKDFDDPHLVSQIYIQS